MRASLVFQPTRPLRGATYREPADLIRHGISTHAPLAGRDEACGALRVVASISTHAPLAGRDGVSKDTIRRLLEFQPTRPLRGATDTEAALGRANAISTHAPLAGRDSYRVASWIEA